MFNFSLLKRAGKTNAKLWIAFTGILVLQMLLVLSVYNPDAGMERVLRALPEGVAALLHINMETDTLVKYLAVSLFGFLYPVISMVYGILAANRLVAKKVESGTMAYLLSSPNGRSRIVNTQAFFLVFSLFVMFGCTAAAGLVFCVVCFPGKLDVTGFLLLHVGVFCLEICLSGIGFLASCISDESRYSLALGAGISTIFLLLRMLADMGGGLEVLKFATIFTLFHTADIVDGSLNICWKFPLLAVIGFLFYWIGIAQFKKRDLPL